MLYPRRQYNGLGKHTSETCGAVLISGHVYSTQVRKEVGQQQRDVTQIIRGLHNDNSDLLLDQPTIVIITSLPL